VEWLAKPLLPFALAFWLLLLARSVQRLVSGREQASQWLPAGVALTLVTGFLVTPFGADPTGRYFLPLAVPMAIYAAAIIDGFLSQDAPRSLAWGMLAGILAFNLWGTVESALDHPPGLTTQFDAVTRIDHSYDQALIAFLSEEGASRGYSNYWVAYPLAFLSQEKLIFVPRLPYHHDFRYSPRDDRYPPYDELVSASDSVAYITVNFPMLDARLEGALTRRGVDWSERRVGDYHVYYDLSQAVSPEELGLIETVGP
jgi:hypothetical protein